MHLIAILVVEVKKFAVKIPVLEHLLNLLYCLNRDILFCQIDVC
jgi:hypothetical protein